MLRMLKGHGIWVSMILLPDMLLYSQNLFASPAGKTEK
jgi:hypothetical protein